MIFSTPLPEREALRQAISLAYRADETATVEALIKAATHPAEVQGHIQATAASLVKAVRAKPKPGGVDAFMQEFELSSKEGIVLMCLAEALLRIPDSATVDLLIEDKLTSADWDKHVGHSDSLFVNASTWAFMLTGNLLEAKTSSLRDLATVLKGILARSTEPLIRTAVTESMRILGRQFIMGRTIEEGLDHAAKHADANTRYSFDMLGEAACTEEDAQSYFASYRHAISAIAGSSNAGPINGSGISVKLSALYSRYEFAQRERTFEFLFPRLKALAVQAKDANIGFTIDAEEAERLELSLDFIEALARDSELAGWDGFGLAVQAYQKRAIHVLQWLTALARRNSRRLMVRLVKGAYWDTEIKLSQEGGFDAYPVFTRKAATDVSYIACAKQLLANRDVIFPQFATHNGHAIATIAELAGDMHGFEFQRLHGMGEPLYEEAISRWPDARVRIYAPCGGYQDLLAYLARRLLENGANTSFVNRILDEHIPVERIVADPIERLNNFDGIPHPHISVPPDLYQPQRRNSRGIDLSDELALDALAADMRGYAQHEWLAAPLVNGESVTSSPAHKAVNPADTRESVGRVFNASAEQVDSALDVARHAFESWNERPVDERAASLERAALLLEDNRAELMTLCVREAGKTIADAVAEVREAVDFCYYYAAMAREDLAERSGHGVFACISPWNFPLAIFTGQIAAALVAGNTVIAKPAEQSPLIAARAVSLIHQAGIPGDALQLLPGTGEVVGAQLASDPRVAGVAFTGGTDTARAIRKSQVAAASSNAVFIAETGGQNAMIVDSSALAEQAVPDIVTSAFGSTGQRCSALRVLYVQKDVAPRIIDMLSGAMEELVIGNPALLRSDIGPVIDADALGVLRDHAAAMTRRTRLIKRCPLDGSTKHGLFFAPHAFEIDDIARLQREVFGPILHVVQYDADKLDAVIDSINATGYGLTHGVHSRIDATVRHITARIKAGNVYVNKPMIGAVVGVQPFGGEGLSGTGPKAGGPHYLRRFSRARRRDGAERSAQAPSTDGVTSPSTQQWEALDSKLDQSVDAALDWDNDPRERIACLERATHLFARDAPHTASLCRRSAAQIEQQFLQPRSLPGPTGELNELSLHGRGLFVCIADSSFGFASTAIPALAAGNTVLLAGNRRHAATLARSLHEAGVPLEVLCEIDLIDAELRSYLLADERIAGVAFVGDTATAHAIDGALAARAGPLIPFIVVPEQEVAGEPEELYRYAAERAVSINTTAAGGNASLYSMEA